MDIRNFRLPGMNWVNIMIAKIMRATEAETPENPWVRDLEAMAIIILTCGTLLFGEGACQVGTTISIMEPLGFYVNDTQSYALNIAFAMAMFAILGTYWYICRIRVGKALMIMGVFAGTMAIMAFTTSYLIGDQPLGQETSADPFARFNANKARTDAEAEAGQPELKGHWNQRGTQGITLDTRSTWQKFIGLRIPEKTEYASNWLQGDRPTFLSEGTPWNNFIDCYLANLPTGEQAKTWCGNHQDNPDSS